MEDLNSTNALILDELHHIYISYGNIINMIKKSEEMDDGNEKVLIDAAIYYACYNKALSMEGETAAKSWIYKLNAKLNQFNTSLT